MTDTQIEREYYIRKLASASVGPQTTLSQLQRRYWSQVVGGVGTNVPLEQLRTMWLLKEISNRGGTAVSNEDSHLWALLAGLIGQTASKKQTENRRLFFKFAS